MVQNLFFIVFLTAEFLVWAGQHFQTTSADSRSWDAKTISTFMIIDVWLCLIASMFLITTCCLLLVDVRIIITQSTYIFTNTCLFISIVLFTVFKNNTQVKIPFIIWIKFDLCSFQTNLASWLWHWHGKKKEIYIRMLYIYW